MTPEAASACSSGEPPAGDAEPLGDSPEPAADPDVSLTQLDRWLGPAMFWLSVCYLGLVAGLAFSLEKGVYPWILLLLLPLYAAETIAHMLTDGKSWWRNAVYCICPPFRIGGRDHVDGGSMWLPLIGWARADRKLEERVEKALSGPMVLPVLALEYHRSKDIEPSSWQMLFLITAQGVIWFSFALEFIVMFSIVPKKLQYCKQHWIDIAIICLPLIAFLRFLRVSRVLRLQQLARAGRVYRLRGVTMRMFRAILLLDVIRRFLQGKPEKRLVTLREQLSEKEREVESIRQEIAEIEISLAEKTKTEEP